MAPWAAGVRERRRTYEGCRDLHQTRSVLAAVSGGGRALREREPPSFGPMEEDIRICFETPEDGQEPRGNRASEGPILHRNIVLCVATWPASGMESRSEQVISRIIATLSGRRWNMGHPRRFDRMGPLRPRFLPNSGPLQSRRSPCPRRASISYPFGGSLIA